MQTFGIRGFLWSFEIGFVAAWRRPVFPRCLNVYLHLDPKSKDRKYPYSCVEYGRFLLSLLFKGSLVYETSVLRTFKNCSYTTHQYTTHHTPLIIHHSSYTTHQTPLIRHHSSDTAHHTPLIIHHSSYTTHHTPLITHHSSYTTHDHGRNRPSIVIRVFICLLKCRFRGRHSTL